MVQLNKFMFPKGGQLLFQEDTGSPYDIAPQRMEDTQAMLDRLDEEYNDSSHIFCEVGPFSDAKSWFICMLDRHRTPPHDYGAGSYKILRLLIDLFFSEKDASGQDGTEFVFVHPDFDIQNVLISEDGSLLALIDWDDVGTAPRCMGNEIYPAWLTRDWDALMYRYNENATPGPDCPNNRENSPSELEHYRDVYRTLIGEICESMSSPSIAAAAKRITSNSLFLHNLYIAVINPMCTHGIVERIFEEIKRITAPRERLVNDSNNEDEHNDDPDDFYDYEFFTAFERGELSNRNLERLTRGFLALLA